MEWHSPFTDQKYYHPYASTGIDNNILEFDIENVSKLMSGKSTAAVEATTARINQHYIKSQRHIKRAFGSKMVENFQEYNWGLALNVEIGLARDKIELLNLALSSDSESKLSEKEFYKVITHHTSYRKLTGRRKKVIFRDIKSCFKKFGTKPPYSPYIVTKHDVLEILDMTGIELDIDFDRLVRTMRASDAEYDRMHMLLMDDPLISGKISANFVRNKPTHRFRIPPGLVHSVGDEPLLWADSDTESESEAEDPMAAFEHSIAQEEEKYGRLYEEMIKKQKEEGEEVAAPALNMDEGDEDASPEKAKKPKKVVGGKTKFDMYNTATGGARKGTKRPMHHVSKPDPAVEALFSKVPKSAAHDAASSQGSEKPPAKKGGVRHRIAMAHAYGKKEAEQQRVELFIPNLPFARKSIPDKDLKDAVEDVLSEADREIHAEIELARRYAFEKDISESEEVGSVLSSKPPEMDASNSTCYPSSALVAPLDSEAKQSPMAKTTSAVDGGEKSKRPAPKKRDLFGQKPKLKKELILGTGPVSKPKLKSSAGAKKTAPPKQVVFNETVVVDEISLVGADESSVTSSITRDDWTAFESESVPSVGIVSGLEAPPCKSIPSNEAVVEKRREDKSGEPKMKHPLTREKPPSKKVPLKDKDSTVGPTPTKAADPGPERVDPTTDVSGGSPDSQPLQRPSTATEPSGVKPPLSLKEPPSKPSTAPTLTTSQKNEHTDKAERKATPERGCTPRTEAQEEDDAAKFLALLNEQAQRVNRASQQRPRTAVPQKVPAYVAKLRNVVRPKTAPEKSAVLTPVEAEEYGSFLDLLENYAGELSKRTKAPPLVTTAEEVQKNVQDIAVAPLRLQEAVDHAIACPKSSGRTRTPILLSPRSHDIVDRPPKSPSPRAFEVLDLPEPIVVPFPLVQLYSMPAQDIEVLVPKTNGQLRLQIRHDDEGDIHGLFVHGFRANCKAEQLNLIKVGDELLKVNGHVVKGGYLEDVVTALRHHDAAEVPMVIRRHDVPTIDQSPADYNYDPGVVGNDDESPRPFTVSNQPFVEEDDFPSLFDLFTLPAQDIEIMVPKTNGQLRIQLRHDDEGDIHGLFVHGFRPFSKAEEQGLIRVADEIIKVNGVIVKGGYLEDVVEILKDHEASSVSIVVRRYSPEMRPGSRGSQLEHYRVEGVSPRPFEVTNFVGTGGSFPPLEVLFKSPSKDIKMMVPKTSGQLRVQLRHDDEGDLHGLFVHGFRPYSKAEEQGLLKVGDEVFKVNGVFVKGGYLEDVVAALEGHSDDLVDITVRRHFPRKK